MAVCVWVPDFPVNCYFPPLFHFIFLFLGDIMLSDLFVAPLKFYSSRKIKWLSFVTII